MLSVGNIAALVLLGASLMFSLVLVTFARARRRLPLWWFSISCLLIGIYSMAMVVVTFPDSPLLLVQMAGPTGYAASALFVLCSTRFALFRIGVSTSRYTRAIEFGLLAVSIASFVPGLVYDFSEMRNWQFFDSSYRFAKTTQFCPFACLTILIGMTNLTRLLMLAPRNRMLIGGSLCLLACGVNDIAISLEFYDGPFAAAFGATIFLVAIALEESAKWGDEAKQLADLKLTLEDRISERTKELSTTLEKLSLNERLAALGRLAASVGHEINNPLTYVVANLELLKMESRPDHAPYIDDALEGSRRIADIVSQLHGIVDADDRSRWQPAEVCESIKTAARTLTPKLPQSHRIEIDADSGLFVYCDKGRLVQLFVNLLSNAIESLPSTAESKRVRVSVKPLGSSVAIVIKDEGRGFPEKFRRKLFEPFSSAREGGLGLGLAIARSIVEELNGEIEIASEEGVGTEASICLPRYDGEVQPARDSVSIVAERSKAAVKRLSILIVDDEHLLLRSLSKSLCDHNIVASHSGTEAISLIRENRFDVVLCDVVMPTISGLDVLAEAALLDEKIADRFIFMSGGCPSEEDMMRINETNARFISKPFNVADFRRMIDGRLFDKPPKGPLTAQAKSHPR